MSLSLILSVFLVGLTPTTALAPVPVTLTEHHQLAPAPAIEIAPKHASRGGEPVPQVEKQVMRVTAYTASDKGMNGRGVTASGERVQEGVTIAAPDSIPFGSKIYIPALNRTYIVTDRGGAIKGNRLDLYFEKRADALEFGVQEMEVWIIR